MTGTPSISNLRKRAKALDVIIQKAVDAKVSGDATTLYVVHKPGEDWEQMDMVSLHGARAAIEQLESESAPKPQPVSFEGVEPKADPKDSTMAIIEYRGITFRAPVDVEGFSHRRWNGGKRGGVITETAGGAFFAPHSAFKSTFKSAADESIDSAKDAYDRAKYLVAAYESELIQQN